VRTTEAGTDGFSSVLRLAEEQLPADREQAVSDTELMPLHLETDEVTMHA
jgi:hypothetical protein